MCVAYRFIAIILLLEILGAHKILSWHNKIIEHKNSTTYVVRNPGPCLGQAQSMTGVTGKKHPTPSDNWFCIQNIYMTNKGNNKITEHRAILQRERQNS